MGTSLGRRQFFNHLFGISTILPFMYGIPNIANCAMASDSNSKLEKQHMSASLPPGNVIVGVGGAGISTVNSLISFGVDSSHTIAINTDAQSLGISNAGQMICIGKKITKGIVTNSNPIFGKKAAYEDIDEIKHKIVGKDTLILTAGLGGGTGSGASPVAASSISSDG